ncbi:hypothetical protein ABVT39_005214 [Epinephelus coioides]
MLATNIPLFREINEMPMIMDPAKLDEELVNYTVETSLSSDGPAISSQPSVSQKQRALLTGDGGRLMKNGGSSGQPIHQLPRVVNNSPSVAANQGAVEGVDWVSSAQHCAVANDTVTRRPRFPGTAPDLGDLSLVKAVPENVPDFDTEWEKNTRRLKHQLLR